MCKRINNSYGSKLAWRWLKKNKFLDLSAPISERTFGAIIKGIHKIFIQRFLKGHSVIFPYEMGRLELGKYKKKIYFKGEKVKSNLPIDWARTLSYWKQDEQAKENKVLIRRDNIEYIYKILYSKNKAKYSNKSLFSFSPARSFKKALSEKIINNEIDAFLI